MQIAVASRPATPRRKAPSPKRNVRLDTSTVPDALRSTFDRLKQGPMSLAVWSRAISPALASDLGSWVSEREPRFDQTRTPRRIDLKAATHGLDGYARDWLIDDLAVLLEQFASVTDARRVRFSFGAVTTDQCRKFHADFVRYRLVSTYVGPGTEWAPDEAVDRDALAHPPDCPCDANARIVRDPSALRQARAGEVLLMRGALHPSGVGAVHRSPPMEHTGRSRLLLVISTVGE
jgi:hypothetical protein